MGAPFTQLYVHLVWATWQRLPLLTAALEAPLYSALAAKCSELRCRLLAVGNVEDHLHVLVQLAATVSVAELVKHLKGSSSHLLNHEALAQGFKWQGAYGAFTVSKKALPAVTAYCRDQKDHHAQRTTYAVLERCEENESP
jgi:REP element-mobilizing transposase RayT